MTATDAIQNVLFVFTDQQHQPSLGCYGNDLVDTPAIDGLAADAVRFDRAYTPTAICTPSRVSVLTGQRPFEHGCTWNTGEHSGLRDDLGSMATYPAAVRDAGANAGHVGKWHLPGTPGAVGFAGEAIPGWGAYSGDHPPYGQYCVDNGFEPFSRENLEDTHRTGAGDFLLCGHDPRPVEATLPYYIAERTIEGIEDFAADGDPFVQTCHFFGPHYPYFLPEEYYYRVDPEDVTLPESSVRETFDGKPGVHRKQHEYWGLGERTTEEWRRHIAGYYGYCSMIDAQVGRVLDALEAQGVAEETLVIFSTDHGGFATRHKLHDKGPTMYEDIYNVPFVVNGPGIEGAAIEDFVSLLDIPPTICDAMGAEVPETFAGRSLFELLGDTGAEDWRNDVVGEFHGHHFPYSQRMLRSDRYKLVVNPAEANELYDLEADPHELRNLYDDGDYREVRERLEDRLYERLEASGDGDFLNRNVWG